MEIIADDQTQKDAISVTTLCNTLYGFSGRSLYACQQRTTGGVSVQQVKVQ